MTRKGINSERKLTNKLFKHGYAAIRVPASGAGSSKYPKPDIVCGNGERYLAFEVKTTSKDVLYIDKHDIQSLVEFSNMFGAEAYIAIRYYNKGTFYILQIVDLLTTRSGNYKIPKNLAKNVGIKLEDLLIKKKKGKKVVKINFNW